MEDERRRDKSINNWKKIHSFEYFRGRQIFFEVLILFFFFGKIEIGREEIIIENTGLQIIMFCRLVCFVVQKTKE